MTLREVADRKLVPVSIHSLYRAARNGEGPFYKVCGVWMAYPSELDKWVRENRGRRANSSADPMPTAKERLLQEIREIRKKA